VTDTLILCYHAMSETWQAPLSVAPEPFAKQLDLLRRRGYRGVTFAQAVGEPDRGKRVAITFDDAFHSVADEAFPALERIGWPATVFVVTDFGDGSRPLCWQGIDQWRGTPFEPELRALSWSELRELMAAGWEVGSHTCSHPHLTALPEQEVLRELTESRLICERNLGVPCGSIAYPYGDVSPAVVQAAGAAGYRAGAALPVGLHPARTLEWPRVGVYNIDRLPRFAIKASALVRRIRTRGAVDPG
jgi:peptidoglycan/xylan/chitin deacetylase (PgdA/CDA1 family)